uniref:Uncharacterized protein n=1 Tax=Rhizobium leguminosarum TaxID=384 RepID=A0A154IP81_RHILE|nr:hypothetical protein A4A59_10545 [Rhizobium leguminosarum]
MPPSELLQSIGKHLLGERDDKSDFSPEAIIADIQMRLDDPHVHRRRQIYMQVGERIGERHWRFLTAAETIRQIRIGTVYPAIGPSCEDRRQIADMHPYLERHSSDINS